VGTKSEEVIERLDLTMQLKSMTASWLFELETLQTIPGAFAGLQHPCVYMRCSMRQVAWCIQLQRLQSIAITEVLREEEHGIVEWMQEHRATSSIVKMRIGLQGDILSDGFRHFLLTPRSLVEYNMTTHHIGGRTTTPTQTNTLGAIILLFQPHAVAPANDD